MRDAPLVLMQRYVMWANARVYGALAGVRAATLAAPTPVFAGSMLRTLNHVHLIGVVWKSHLLGVPHGFTMRNPETTPPLAELSLAQAALDAWFIDYAQALPPALATEVVPFTFIGGGAGQMTRAEILLHIATHSSYHRGHLTAMLWQAGIQPPVTDLPVYVREAAQTNSSRCAS